MGASSLIIGFIVAATVLGGFLAGANLDRMVIQMPAWRQTGVKCWAEFSRHADLRRGFYVYPPEAIGMTILNVLAAISFYYDKAAPKAAGLPIYLAAVLALAGLLTTLKAAPHVLSLRRIGDDPDALLRAFLGFWYRGNVRAVFQIAAFLATVWALVAVLQ